MEKYLIGWKSIEKYLCLSRHVIIKRGYPVSGSRVPESGLIPEPLMPIRHTYLPDPICYVTFQGLSSVLGSAQALCCSHFSQGLPFSRQESY